VFPSGVAKGELVLIIELLEDLREFSEEVARRHRENNLWPGERKLLCR
jgi:hypothetical protein